MVPVLKLRLNEVFGVTRNQLNSKTIKEFLDGSTGTYLKRDDRVAALAEPELWRFYGNTCLLRTKSSKFYENQTYYHEYILLQDIKTIIKERKISLADAIHESITFGETKVYSDDLSYLYWGWKYKGTVEGYNYASYREYRAPTKNNTNLIYDISKHLVKALYWIVKNQDVLETYIMSYYDRIKFDPNKLLAINKEYELAPMTKPADGSGVEVVIPSGEDSVIMPGISKAQQEQMSEDSDISNIEELDDVVKKIMEDEDL